MYGFGRSRGRWLAGFAAILLVYILFIAREIVQAAYANMALGTRVFAVILVTPLFWIASVCAFALVFWWFQRPRESRAANRITSQAGCYHSRISETGKKLSG